MVAGDTPSRRKSNAAHNQSHDHDIYKRVIIISGKWRRASFSHQIKSALQNAEMAEYPIWPFPIPSVLGSEE